MNLDEAMAKVAKVLDDIIESKMTELETRIRRDIALAGPEDEEALDRPPEPESPWRRGTVEETLMLQREAYASWRATTLAEIRARLLDDMGWEPK